MVRLRARHLRRRPGSLALSMMVAVALLAVASTVAVARIRRHPQLVSITVMVSGLPRIAMVAKPATAAAALKMLAVAPRPGRLLSLVTHSVVNADFTPVRLMVGGRPVAPEARLRPRTIIEVIEPADVTEEAVEGGDVIPAPPMPAVIHGLWHPGQPGRAISRKGAVSGEVVTQKLLQPPVPPVAVTEKIVALTFDDGPGRSTPEVLRILREKNVKALFCVVTRELKGDRLVSAKAALADGHHICNHTVNHDEKLPSKPQNVIDEEIIGGNRQIAERLGLPTPPIYRPPGGALGPNVIATAQAQGQQLLLWTVDTKDYTKPPPAAIVGAVMGQIRPGGVVLMHDGGGDRSATVAALPIIIDLLRAAGYEFVIADAVTPVPAAPVSDAAPAA